MNFKIFQLTVHVRNCDVGELVYFSGENHDFQ